MFRTLIYPSSGACDCAVELPHRSFCSRFVVCWRFGAAGCEWCPCCNLKPATRPRGLRLRSAAARLLKLWVRFPPGAWMSCCYECCVLSGICLCDELITRTEESYRLWYVVVCVLETSWVRRFWPTGGCCAKKKNMYNIRYAIWGDSVSRYLADHHLDIC